MTFYLHAEGGTGGYILPEQSSDTLWISGNNKLVSQLMAYILELA